jgi:hypothetical protein
MLIGYIVFAVILFRDLDQRNEMVRIAIPPFALLAALVIPAAVNARQITVSQEGVRLRNVPIPKGKNYDVPRDKIRSCTIRVVRTKLKHGEVTTYIVGVESSQGQIDLAYPYSKYDDAKVVCEQFLAALNQGPVSFRIGFEWAQREPEGSRKRRVITVLAWGGAFIAAIFLGAYWELVSSGGG